jgi:tetratricopeptide (TPR) repeat protein
MEDYEQAEELIQKALVVYREVGIKRRLPFSLLDLGELAKMRGNYDRAREHIREALDLADHGSHAAAGSRSSPQLEDQIADQVHQQAQRPGILSHRRFMLTVDARRHLLLAPNRMGFSTVYQDGGYESDDNVIVPSPSAENSCRR